MATVPTQSFVPIIRSQRTLPCFVSALTRPSREPAIISISPSRSISCVCAGDIDRDGDIEIIAGSRDGRVRALTKQGNVRWERIIGTKDWVGTVAIIPQNRIA